VREEQRHSSQTREMVKHEMGRQVAAAAVMQALRLVESLSDPQQQVWQ
jgi:hypothetical protein